MTPADEDLPVDFFRRTSLGDKLDKFLFETNHCCSCAFLRYL